MPTSSSLPGSQAAWAAGALRVRWVARTPVRLYRARLGFLFGSRLLMLEHTGRSSGARRYAVLEVVGHPRPGTYLVASGFGARAEWFRNVRTDPRVRIWVGGHQPAPATARLLAPKEATAALIAYAASHPRTWAALKPVFAATLDAPPGAASTSLPIIALHLADRTSHAMPSPP